MNEYYGEIEQERLDYSKKEVIERVFDSIESIEGYKYPFVIHTFTPKNIILTIEEILGDVLQRLDEEYGDPEGDGTMPTNKMITAAKELVNVIKSEYTSFMCETNGDKTEYTKEQVLNILGE